MTRCNNLIALAAIVAAALFSGCHTDSASRAAPVPEATPAVHLVKQQGVELLQFNASDVPGLSIIQVQNIEMPGLLETSGQITYDDRSTSTIVSRVAAESSRRASRCGTTFSAVKKSSHSTAPTS